MSTEVMIDFYTFNTPNGQKIHIALEELGLSYRTHVIHIGTGDQFKSEYLKVNPKYDAGLG